MERDSISREALRRLLHAELRTIPFFRNLAERDIRIIDVPGPDEWGCEVTGGPDNPRRRPALREAQLAIARLVGKYRLTD